MYDGQQEQHHNLQRKVVPKMSRTTVTMVTVTDDLTGKTVDESDVQACEITFNGQTRTLDLTAESVGALEEFVSGTDLTALRALFASKPRAHSNGSRKSGETVDREWLRAQGYDVKDRGKLPDDAAAAWEAHVEAASADAADDDDTDVADSDVADDNDDGES